MILLSTRSLTLESTWWPYMKSPEMDQKSFRFSRLPEMSLENVVVVETLLILLGNLDDVLLELEDPLSSWIFSVPDLLQKILLFHRKLGICIFQSLLNVISSFALSLFSMDSDASISLSSSRSTTSMFPNSSRTQDKVEKYSRKYFLPKLKDSRLIFCENRMMFNQGIKWKDWTLKMFFNACVLRTPHQLPRLFIETHPGTNIFPPTGAFLLFAARVFRGSISFPQSPFQWPRSRTATLENSFCGSYVGLTVPWAVSFSWSYHRTVTQSRATLLEDDLHFRSNGNLAFAKALSVSPHSGADGLVQGELPTFFFSPWMLTVFTSLACYPGALLTAAVNGWLLDKDRWGLSSPYHVAATYPYGQPGSSSLATN